MGARQIRYRLFEGKRTLVALGTCVVILVIAAGGWFLSSRSDSNSPGPRRQLSGTVFGRACALPPLYLERIWNGYDPALSQDITIVPRQPNFLGSFNLTNHSGPWGYLQRVPLILYGPERIASQGELNAEASMVDVYPTVGRLLNVELEEREGRVLEEVLLPAPDEPRLVVVVVWDGAGRATLDRWPGAWPNLQRMSTGGVSYTNATVGSSPSVTAPVHSTLGTGAYPKDHGITGLRQRTDSGGVTEAFDNLSTESLQLTTFADQVDELLNNRPKVGMLAWIKWHMGMLGHGNALNGGDADELGLIHYRDGVEVYASEAFQGVERLERVADPADEIDTLDREDGAVDGRWLGNDIALPEGEAPWNTYSNPAWARFQADLAISMLARGHYGRDSIPDLWFTNFKMSDVAGHSWGLDSEESRAVVEAQDEALGRILDYLDEEVGDYVVVLTADHGATPLPTSTGAWPILQRELILDIDGHFDIPDGESLIESSSAAGYFIDAEVPDKQNVSLDEISAFVNDYTIGQNWTSNDLPPGYENRGAEQVFSAAFPTEQLDTIRTCANSK